MIVRVENNIGKIPEIIWILIYDLKQLRKIETKYIEEIIPSMEVEDTYAELLSMKR